MERLIHVSEVLWKELRSDHLRYDSIKANRSSSHSLYSLPEHLKNYFQYGICSVTKGSELDIGAQISFDLIHQYDYLKVGPLGKSSIRLSSFLVIL